MGKMVARTKRSIRQPATTLFKDSFASPRAKRKKRAVKTNSAADRPAGTLEHTVERVTGNARRHDKTSTEVEPPRGGKRRKRTTPPKVPKRGVNEVLRNALFEDLALAEDEARSGTLATFTDTEMPVWVTDRKAVAALRNALRSRKQVDALCTFVGEMVHSALHSALVSIDGGSASAEVGRVRMVDERGVTLGEGLHELFIDYLFETGRLT
jgi:hypothetical protein